MPRSSKCFSTRTATCWTFLALAVLLSLTTACDDASLDVNEDELPEEATRFTSEAKPIGNGTAQLFVDMADDDTPKAIGIRLTADAFSGLPSPEEAPTGSGHTLSFPDAAPVPPYDHFDVHYMPAGHYPEVYETPHFDLHAYIITREERDAMTPDTAPIMEREPDAQYLPNDYAYLDDSAIPHMGGHWVDTTSPEFNSDSFTHTYIYGFNDAEMAFVEPMITYDFLQNLDEPVRIETKLPPKVQHTGYYPGAYEIKVDADTGDRIITMENLVYMEAE